MTEADLKARIAERVAATPSPTRGRLRAADTATVGLGIGVAVACFVSFGAQTHVWERPVALMAATTLGTLAFAVGAAWIALGRRKAMLGYPRAVLLGVAGATPVALFLWKIGWSAGFAGGLDWDPLHPGLRCLALSTLVGSALFAATFAVRRGTDPVHPGATGTALGVAVGAAAAVAVDLWCAVGHPEHVLLGHVLPMLGFGVLGGLFGRRWLDLDAP